MIADKPISEERILQLTNDQSEGINSGTLSEWREVARYWVGKHERQTHRLMGIMSSVAALTLAKSMESNAMRGIEAWAKRENE